LGCRPAAPRWAACSPGSRTALPASR
jgi:hypothetical protein